MWNSIPEQSSYVSFPWSLKFSVCEHELLTVNLKAPGQRVQDQIMLHEFCFVVDFLLTCRSQALCTMATLYMFFCNISSFEMTFLCVFQSGKIQSHSVVGIEDITDQYFLHYPTWGAHLDICCWAWMWWDAMSRACCIVFTQRAKQETKDKGFDVLASLNLTV